ncbi:hypothetical protein HCN44_007739 [Aphidius gifuensis]|uniref:Uncharacterized protein n=1 Tax=Aphidius gifuensis TaxID=684658 RepID=A0A835CN72_APHGI|nr:hypothetical protein HCN44_007739 [Aphidius gifuensis]
MALNLNYVNCVAVLKELSYIDVDDRVTLKGRLTLDMGKDEEPDIKFPFLKQQCKLIQQVRATIKKVAIAYGVDPVKPLSFGLVEIVYK